jgi:hypothetical protein
MSISDSWSIVMNHTNNGINYISLLEEAIDGSILGVKIGDTIDAVRERLGSPDALGHITYFVIYYPAEISIDKTIRSS